MYYEHPLAHSFIPAEFWPDEFHAALAAFGGDVEVTDVKGQIDGFNDLFSASFDRASGEEDGRRHFVIGYSYRSHRWEITRTKLNYV